MTNAEQRQLITCLLELMNCAKEVCDFDWTDAPPEVLHTVLPLHRALATLAKEIADAASTRH